MAQSQQPPFAAQTSECPSDEDLLAFARGKLSDPNLSGFHSHLDACCTCQRVLAEAAHSLATAQTSPLGDMGDDWNTTFQRGTLVGRRYVIQRFITRGGMGEVYEAFDRELAQRVALKTVTSTASDNSRAVRRLKAEVQLARLVSHPNVCRIYDFGTHPVQGSGADIHFLTMEFVEGETLGQRVRLAGALPLSEAHKVARDLLLGLRAVHAAGVLHRDFKSDNVMLQYRSSGASHAVVLDFGLARALGHDVQSASHSNLVGTFGYIAPEQLEGKPHTHASDLYAFGVVWFELLTGQLPFETDSASSPRVKQRSQVGVPPPSLVNPELPRELDALVLKCLERSPRNRFQSVDEVLAALDAMNSPQRRARLRLIAAASAVALSLAGAVWASRSPEIAEASAPPLTVTATPRAPQPRSPEENAPEPMNTHVQPATIPVGTAELVPLVAAALSAPSSPKAPGRPRPPPRATQEPSEKSLPAREPTEPPAEAQSAESMTAPAPSPPPASSPEPRLKKPDWENPFGSIHPTELAATATATAT